MVLWLIDRLYSSMPLNTAIIRQNPFESTAINAEMIRTVCNVQIYFYQLSTHQHPFCFDQPALV